ncbi:MAG: hypothetical protein ACRBCI_01155 [Cellvibrionaceae bacterium]
MKTPIKAAIGDLYKDIELSSKELEDIQSLAQNTEKVQPQRKALFERIRANSLITIACTLVLSISIWSLTSDLKFNISKTEAIIADVIDNHLLHKNLEYQTSSLSELNSQFAYLGFMLSKLMTTEKHGELMGARPCFILDIPAAQLRYQKSADAWTTVFQTRYQKNIYGPIPDLTTKKEPLVKVERGVKVSLWRENGLLFAVAQANQ